MKADLSTEMLGIRGYFQQGCGAGPKQKIVDNLLVGQRQTRKLVWEA